ncbi:MAG: hypothetical protein JWN71_516 [Xanthobacteraceae bacterium]|jgi:hypothetical protein|nr:hypothetical protein [Xanthobacteraceae bacterium]
MDELLVWLKQQNGGMLTLVEFQQKAAGLVEADRDHAALFQLLAILTGRFVSSYDGEPLPIDVARHVLGRLTGLVEQAAQSTRRPPAEQLKVLNEIAGTDLAPTS